MKQSATASAVPTAGQLLLGEIAINTADGKMFIKKSDNTIVQVGAGSVVDAGTLTGATLASNVVNSSLTVVGVLAELAVLDPIDADLAGNAYTANALFTTRSISLGGEASGTTNFDGSSNVTITTTIPLLDGGNY